MSFLNDEYVAMTRSYFQRYTQLEILEFRDTPIQHLESIKKSIDEREHQKIEYDSWVNERQMQTTEEKVDTSKSLDASSVDTESSMQTTEEKVDTSKALDASSVDTESSVTESKEKDTSSRSGNDAHDDDVDIRPIYDEEPMDKERQAASAKPRHMITSSNSRISLKNTPRFSLNDMVHNHYLEEAKKKTQECSRNSEPSLMPSARSQSTTNGSKPKPRRNTQTSRNWPASNSHFTMTKTVPIAEHLRNSRNFFDSKHFVCSTCQQCVFSANHVSCLTKSLKEVNSRAKVQSNKTTNRNKLVEQISVAKKPERQIPKGHSHYTLFPKERQAASAKPRHMITSSNSRISLKNTPRFSLNDMVHNHYLEEAKKKTQECSRNSEPSLMPSARSQSTTNGSKPKPRRNTQTSRNWPASNSHFTMTKT
nr:hypothetical protein [Tanacetum cinerariifolium]